MQFQRTRIFPPCTHPHTAGTKRCLACEQESRRLTNDERLALFWSKVDTSGECWRWTAQISTRGYGRFTEHRRSVSAHRWVYRQVCGPIPSGLQIDHRCNTRACVRPAHLQLLTPRDNTLRGTSFSAKNARATHCVNGHEFTADNTYTYKRHDHNGRPERRCRICHRRRRRGAVRRSRCD